MPKVPQIPHKQIKSIYNPINGNEPATMKQKNYITILCERRKIQTPDLKHMTKAQAAIMLSEMTNA